ncbi:MAG: hypothetical protein ACP5HZ_10115 [Ferrimicrobium sp.]
MTDPRLAGVDNLTPFTPPVDYFQLVDNNVDVDVFIAYWHQGGHE